MGEWCDPASVFMSSLPGIKIGHRDLYSASMNQAVREMYLLVVG